MRPHIQSITLNENGTITFKFIRKYKNGQRGWPKNPTTMTFPRAHVEQALRDAKMVVPWDCELQDNSCMRTQHPPVRAEDPFTSWAAAYEQDEKRVASLKALVRLALMTYGPLTHDHLITVVNRVRPASPSGVRTRVSELVEDGLVERVPDMVAKSRYGRASLLWRIVR